MSTSPSVTVEVAPPLTPPPGAPFRTTLALDFDGVIHRYSKGWHTRDIYDPPNPGTFEALLHLHKRHNLFVFSARDPNPIVAWCNEQAALALPDVVYPRFRLCTEQEEAERWFSDPTSIGVTNFKLGALAYIDDRAIRFTNWTDVCNYFA